MIISLLGIKPKATPSINPTNDFYWGQKSSCLNVMRGNYTTSRPAYYSSTSIQPLKVLNSTSFKCLYIKHLSYVCIPLKVLNVCISNNIRFYITCYLNMAKVLFFDLNTNLKQKQFFNLTASTAQDSSFSQFQTSLLRV